MIIQKTNHKILILVSLIVASLFKTSPALTETLAANSGAILAQIIRNTMSDEEQILVAPLTKNGIFEFENKQNLHDLCSIREPYLCNFYFKIITDKFENAYYKELLARQISVCKETSHPNPCWAAISAAKIYITRGDRYFSSENQIFKLKELLGIPKNIQNGNHAIPEDDSKLLDDCISYKKGACAKLFWKYEFDKTSFKCLKKKTPFCDKIRYKLLDIGSEKKLKKLCEAGNFHICADLLRKDKQRLLSTCLDTSKNESKKSCVWVIEDKIEIPFEKKSIVYSQACYYGSYCWEARKFAKDDLTKESLLYYACLHDAADARCSKIDKSKLFLVNCAIFSGNACFAYLRLKLKEPNSLPEENTQYYKAVVKLCTAGYTIGCSEASRLIIRKNPIKGMDYLDEICSEEFSPRDGCTSKAVAHYIHGSTDTAKKVITQMASWGFWSESEIDENMDWIKENAQKRYNSDLLGIDDYISKN